MDLLDLVALMLLLMGVLFLASALLINRAWSGLRERRAGPAGEGRGTPPPPTAHIDAGGWWMYVLPTLLLLGGAGLGVYLWVVEPLR